MPKWMKFMTVIAALVLCAGVYAMVQMRQSHNRDAELNKGFPPGPLRPDGDPSNPFLLHDFELVDQDGEHFNLAGMNKKISIVAFVFSSCRLACPAIVAHMQQIERELADTKIQFVCFSIDPENDTPEVMRRWAKDLNADTSRWKFVTEQTPWPAGKPQQIIRRMMTEDLKEYWGPDPKNKTTSPTGQEMDNIQHPTKFFVFGPRAQLLGTYRSVFPEQIEALKQRARAADREFRGIK